MNAFIHTFKVADEYFFYDVNKNNILQISHKLYKYLSVVSDNSENKPKMDFEIKRNIENLKERGYLSTDRIEQIEHPMSKFIESYLTSKLQSICLQVTQNCNLRCQYCVYSGGYNNREHSNKVMDIETAKKSVDFLIKNSSESDTVCIGFYGGEPLLNFELIEETVHYAIENYPGKDYYFALTTNGTVFSEKILDFLEKYNFAVTISLDGNKETHDANRKYANSNKGSFDEVLKNIHIIKEKYKKISSKIMFSVVLSVSSDFMGCNDFFPVQKF